jgi:menaquinone-specific isochorismate synthase
MSEQYLESDRSQIRPKPALANGPKNAFQRAVRQLKSRLAQLTPSMNQLIHTSIEVPAIDLLGWLADNPHPEQSYWQNRDSQFALAGLDRALVIEATEFSQVDRVMTDIKTALEQASSIGTGAVFLGGIGFDSGMTGPWQAFKAVSFQAPLCFVHQRHGQFELGFNLYSATRSGWHQQTKRLTQLLAGLCFDTPPKPVAKNAIVHRQDSLSLAAWRDRVAQTLSAIANGQIQKAVLARRVDLHLAHAANLPDLLNRWRDLNPASFSFLLSQSGTRFLGCSPERLFVRRHQRLDTEAIAGTLPRGRNRADDFFYGRQLLTDPKLRREHRLVSDFIGQQLAPFCTEIDTQHKAHVLKLSAIQHLCQPIQANLQPGVANHQLVQALHPTPAVCGYPRQAAKDLIDRLEPVERGWYSGAVGVVSDAGAEFAVAIRSALCRNNRLFCYSGVGIVEGSVAEQEWYELESKLQTLLELIEQ